MSKEVDFAARFWGNVTAGTKHECWPWERARSGSGYGIVRLHNPRRMQVAHRVAWELSGGSPVPNGMVLMHACDNKICCNPNHLSIGTQKDNMQDCIRKGRRQDGSGEKHPAATITADAVHTIRREWVSWPRHRGAVKQFAEKHGLYYETMRAILKRRSWKNI